MEQFLLLSAEPELPIEETPSPDEEATTQTQSALGSLTNGEADTVSKEGKEDASRSSEKQDGTISEVPEGNDDMVDEKTILPKTVCCLHIKYFLCSYDNDYY